MRNAREEPYFGLFAGKSALYSELNATAPLVDIFVAEGKVVRQTLLPFGGVEDSVVWMPGRVKQRREFEEHRIETVRAELAKMVRVPIQEQRG